MNRKESFNTLFILNRYDPLNKNGYQYEITEISEEKIVLQFTSLKQAKNFMINLQQYGCAFLRQFVSLSGNSQNRNFTERKIIPTLITLSREIEISFAAYSHTLRN